MSLISRLLQVVPSWRRRRGGPKAVKRAAPAMEHLDHRQLLSVNFTGNVATDFPATSKPGVVVIPDNPSVTHPGIPSDLKGIVNVSGFDISGIRVSYDPTADVLSIGLEQPLSGLPGQPGPVIAGDADDDGNAGSTSPKAAAAGIQDYPDFGGSAYMGAFLDLKQTGYADVVAGFSGDDPRTPKQYEVAQAVVDRNAPPVRPDFGATLPDNAGNVSEVNSPAHPNLEFDIDHFARLYLSETGKALTPNSLVGIGAFGGSGDDGGIGEGYFPEQTIRIGDATMPTPPGPIYPPPTLVSTSPAVSTPPTVAHRPW